MHKNIIENEPDNINENELDENTFADVSDIRVSIKGSYLRWSSRSSRPVKILEPELNGQS